MVNFTVRVELHEVNNVKPSGDDYQELHLAMQRKQYFRVIRSDDDKWYLLPPAEYNVAWDVETKTVLDEVASIVKTVWTKFGILVTKSNGRTWQGLKELTATQAQQLRNTNV